MTDLEPVLRDLVIANRILANENVVDAYGHVSVRSPLDPERYFLSCSRSPELVQRSDIMEFRLDGTPVTLLVVNMDQGRDLARQLAGNRIALMRGHGFAATGRNLSEVVRVSVMLPRNARILTTALQFGGVRPLSPGEVALRQDMDPDHKAFYRAWEYWATRAGCGDMLGES